MRIQYNYRPKYKFALLVYNNKCVKHIQYEESFHAPAQAFYLFLISSKQATSWKLINV